MTDEISGKPRVPKEELKALVEEWRGIDSYSHQWYASHQFETLEYCADELEALIERYDYE